MNVKYTPGPWISIGNYIGTVGDETQTIAYVDDHRNAKRRTTEETLANARLIAAAPDLLAACEKLVSYRRRVGPLNFQLEKANDYIRMIEQAIAAAHNEATP